MADKIDKALPNVVKEKALIETPEEVQIEESKKIQEVNDQGVEVTENEDGSAEIEFDPGKVAAGGGEEQFKEIIEGEVPEHLKKKAEGGIIETGEIARRPGAVPPLSGPTPQGEGIVGLFSNPKQVNVGS